MRIASNHLTYLQPPTTSSPSILHQIRYECGMSKNIDHHIDTLPLVRRLVKDYLFHHRFMLFAAIACMLLVAGATAANALDDAAGA